VNCTTLRLSVMMKSRYGLLCGRWDAIIQRHYKTL
jgi:hypothetical protein